MAVADLAVDLGVTEAVAAYDSYRQQGGIARLREPSDFSTAVVVQGRLLWFYATRALSDVTPAQDRLRSELRLDQMLTHPLTREVVATLLRAFGIT